MLFFIIFWTFIASNEAHKIQSFLLLNQKDRTVSSKKDFLVKMFFKHFILQISPSDYPFDIETINYMFPWDNFVDFIMVYDRCHGLSLQNRWLCISVSTALLQPLPWLLTSFSPAPPIAVWEQFVGKVSWCRTIHMQKKFCWTGGTTEGGGVKWLNNHCNFLGRNRSLYWTNVIGHINMWGCGY